MALEKATIITATTNARVSVLFNPEEYTLSRENTFAQAVVPGLSGPLLQFVSGALKTLDMELFLDTYETGGDVRDLAVKVTGLMDIDPATHAPPVLLFTWGSLSFSCVLAKASQRFIMFRPDGTPVRARLQVTFAEVTVAHDEAKATKRETTDYSHLHVVAQGETLSGIAATVYRSATLWRPIAIRNAIDDPLVLAVGQQLLVPQLPFVDPETGEVLA